LKRLTILAALCGLLMLALAGPALAQALPGQYAPSNLTGTGQYLVGTDDGVCAGEGEIDPDCAQAFNAALEAALAEEAQAAAQYAAPEAPAAGTEAAPVASTEAAPTASAEGLPSTGGTPLLPIAACLLAGAGLLGTLAWRR
jgi:nucleoid-associated protein YgaU